MKLSSWIHGTALAALIAVASIVPAQDAPAAPKATSPANAILKMETTLGDIYLELDGAKAPISTMNFVQYAKDKYYDGTIFHRVMDGFMIQGGGYDVNLAEKKSGLRAPIKNEWKNGLKNARGTIAMARTQVADSATSQFFINVVNNDMLDQANDGAAYAVFGSVVQGLDVVDKIRQTPVKNDPRLPMGKVVPETPVVIKSVTVVEFNEEAAKQAAAESEAALAKAMAEEKVKGENELQDRIKFTNDAKEKGTKKASGLIYHSLKDGEGDFPKPTSNVTVHYTGWFLDGKKFDSSVDRGEKATFPLNRVIAGWTEGVQLMKPGGKAILVIPGDLAYGKRPPPGIPPDATLTFEIELFDVK